MQQLEETEKKRFNESIRLPHDYQWDDTSEKSNFSYYVNSFVDGQKTFNMAIKILEEEEDYVINRHMERECKLGKDCPKCLAYDIKRFIGYFPPFVYSNQPTFDRVLKEFYEKIIFFSSKHPGYFKMVGL